MLTKEIRSAVADVAQKSYWRERDAAVVMAAFEQSGGTLASFARQCGLNVKRLYRWQRIFESKAASLSTTGAQFHPVVVVDESPPVPSAGLEVWSGGRRVVVQPGFDEGTLKRLLHVLDASESC